MPELPEIHCRALEMDEHLRGRVIRSIEVRQPKCLNVEPELFCSVLAGARIGSTSYHGKWLRTETSQGSLLINLGMGGELLLTQVDRLPEKWRVRLDFEDAECLAVNFWWFGSTHFVSPGELDSHTMTARLGPNALDLSCEEFQTLLAKRRGRIKSFLLDQSKIAGIGNAYIHDILFRAELHPLRSIPSLQPEDTKRLHDAMMSELRRSIAKGGAQYELNLFGKRGGFGADDLLVGYREGKPCPSCGAEIEKLKTGSTTSYICPACQLL